MKNLLAGFAVVALAGCAGTGGGPVGPDKVVYHLGEGLAQATNGLRNLRNRKLQKNLFIEEATYVPSGVAEITRLQQREGYACLRP